jgi:hypothetical protein
LKYRLSLQGERSKHDASWSTNAYEKALDNEVSLADRANLTAAARSSANSIDFDNIYLVATMH